MEVKAAIIRWICTSTDWNLYRIDWEPFIEVALQVPFQKADDIDNILIEYEYPATEKVEFFKLINVSR